MTQSVAARAGSPAQPAPPQPLLDVAGLRVVYRRSADQRPAVDGADVHIGRGERLALVGESGSGKTTLGLTIAGLLTGAVADITADHMTFAGRDIGSRPARQLPARIPGMSMIFQDAMSSLDPVWTIGSQLRAVLRGAERLTRRESDAEARNWLSRVGMREVSRVMGSRPYELSGGMRQRVMVALALASRPDLLIADEPTSALDTSLARGTMRLIVGLAADAGAGLLIISHDIHLCREFSDRTLVMYGGRIVENVASPGLFSVAAHPYTTGLLRSVPTLQSASLAELPTIAGAAGHGQRDPRDGCSFRPRCPAATEQCLAPPDPRTIEPDHVIRCWNAGPAGQSQEGGAGQ